MKDLYIIGAGGLGKEVAWLVERINKQRPTWNLKGFVDENEALHGDTVCGYPVLGNLSFLIESKSTIWAAIAIGSSKTRNQIDEHIRTIKNIQFATLVDPSVQMSDCVQVGEGTILCLNTSLTVDITVGRHVLVNPACTVGHDVVLEDYVTLFPSVNISGNVRLESCVEVGVGAQVLQGRIIGQSAIIGAGAVVVRDIAKDTTAVGVPARVIRG